MLTVGSLCTGFGGLEHALSDVFGETELVFVADPGSKIDDDRWDDGPVKLLAHRYPDVPNLGDIAAVDWTALAKTLHVDVLAMGFPCTDVSLAGKQEGLLPGNRSGVWNHCVTAIRALRPSLVVIEDVGGLLSARAHSNLEPCPWCVGDEPGGTSRITLRALGAVLGDLSDLGFDAEWCALRASDAGAAHGRKRIFILAWPADAKSHTRRLVNRDRRPVPDAHGSGQRPDLGHVRAGQPDADRSSQGSLSLLPTPKSSDGKHGDSQAEHCRKSPSLTAVGALFPTSTASDVTGAGRAAQGGRNLRTEVTLLPTPRATDGTNGGPNQRGSSGDLMLPSAVALLPTPTATPYGHQQSASPGADSRGTRNATAGRKDSSEHHDGWTLCDVVYDGRWGQYTPAIERWETIIDRPAPDPTVPSKGKNPQLNPVFVEWLIGCVLGWVTDVPGLTRNQMLRLLGNGVVRQQGAAAIRHLLVVSGLWSAS